MTLVKIKDTQKELANLIEMVLRGDDIVLTKDNKPVARLVAIRNSRKKRKLGTARGLIEVANDFDETPEAFGEYV